MTNQTYSVESVDDFDKHYLRLHNYLMFIDIKANSLKLFLHYARLCTLRNKQANASDETIARMMNTSEKTISRSRKELEKRGLITIIETPGKPYIIKIDFTALRKENEKFWDEHDFMGETKDTPPTNCPTTPDKSSDLPRTKVPTKNKVVKNEVEEEKIMPEKISGLPEPQYKKPIGPEPFKNTYTPELKNYIASEYFGWHDIDKVTVGNWKVVTKMLKQIFTVHDAHGTECTVNHLRLFKDDYLSKNSKLEFTLNANMERNYQTWYMLERAKRETADQYEISKAKQVKTDFDKLTAEERSALSSNWRELILKQSAVAS